MKGSSLAWVAACALTSITTNALAGGHAFMSLARPAPPPHAAVMLHLIPAPAAAPRFVQAPWNGNGHPLAYGNRQGWRFGHGDDRYGWNGNRWNGYGWRHNGGNGQWTSALGLGDGGYFGSPQDEAPQYPYVQPAPLILVEPFAVPENSSAWTNQGSSGPLIIYVNRDKSAALAAGASPKVVYGDTPAQHSNGPRILYGESWK